MSWTAIVPLKPAGLRKTRLAGRLNEAARTALGARLFDHVAAILAADPRIATVAVLSETRPEGWQDAWIADEGRGLNPELEAARATRRDRPLLVIHADLPLLAAEDIAALLTAAEQGGHAIAPDRHRTGTNALAHHHGPPVSFRFGAGSFLRHRAGIAGGGVIVERPGLSLDLDTPDDLDAALAGGFSMPGIGGCAAAS